MLRVSSEEAAAVGCVSPGGSPRPEPPFDTDSRHDQAPGVRHQFGTAAGFFPTFGVFQATREGGSPKLLDARELSVLVGTKSRGLLTGEAACVGTPATLAAPNTHEHVGPGADAGHAGPAHGHRERR